jgi:hypothetical protein
VNPFGVLRFTNSPVAVDASQGELSALVSANTTIKGWVQGSATFQGNVVVLPGTRVPYPPQTSFAASSRHVAS